MSFGQPSGPPATARQLGELTTLVEGAGHTGFRDARGPLGLTQRQAGGRFTRDEAAALIERLEAEAGERDADGPGGRGPARPDAPVDTPVDRRGVGTRAPGTRAGGLAEQLTRVPEELLVDELRRRGWALIPPSLAT
jgi:hypothetical protein